MINSWKCSWWALTLLVAFAAAVLAADSVVARPVATVSDCTFTPARGGPGTIIHARVDQWYSSGSVGVGFAVPRPPAVPGGPAPAVDQGSGLQPLGAPLAVMSPSGGFAEVAFPLPARLPNGRPIPTSDLYLVCMGDGQINMGEGAGPAPFTFLAGTLPGAGAHREANWGLVTLVAVALLLAGARLRRRSQA